MEQSSRVCIVTGSATGVGAACAIQLARRGYRVVVNYTRSEREARETAERCTAEGTEAMVVQGDVAVDADCRRIAASAVDRWGRIDGLVNNAGITKFVGLPDLEGVTAEDWQHLYAVNVVGTFQMTRACVPAMRAAGRGSVVNVSSMSAFSGAGSSIPYVATKGAMNALTLTLARALAPEIRVNSVAPGLVKTRWHADRFGDQAAYDEFLNAYDARVPLGHAATADDIAEVAVWLLDGAGHVTGEIVKADGGMQLGKLPPALGGKRH